MLGISCARVPAGASGPSATDTEVKTFVPEMAHMKRRETSALALQECHLLQIESTVVSRVCAFIG